jgi:hypothetical protein
VHQGIASAKEISGDKDDATEQANYMHMTVPLLRPTIMHSCSFSQKEKEGCENLQWVYWLLGQLCYCRETVIQMEVDFCMSILVHK